MLRCSPPLRVLHGRDNVQVKWEMLRAHLVDRLPVTEEAAAHGFSRATPRSSATNTGSAAPISPATPRRAKRATQRQTNEGDARAFWPSYSAAGQSACERCGRGIRS
jgi:hypothetical protein